MNSSLIPLLTFIIITIIYFIILTYLSNKNEYIITMIYFVVLLSTQFGMGILQSRNICGEIQLKNVLSSVLIPWIFIFGSMVLLIEALPSLKQPFSNTIGYLIVRLRGVNHVFLSMMKRNTQTKTLGEIFDTIYKDPSLLINTFTPNNFDDAMKALQHLWNTQSSTFEQQQSKLKSIVKMKDEISRFIWYMLTGLFTSSLTTMNLSSVECSQSPEYINQTYNKLKKKLPNIDTDSIE